MIYLVFPQIPPVEPLWNLLKNVEDGQRFHRGAGFYTSFTQVFAQPYNAFTIDFSIR
jgi:hypothetical protein